MEIQTVFGRIILFDKEAERPNPEAFIRIDGNLYPMSRLKSAPPILEQHVEVILEDTWEPTHRVMATPMGPDIKMHSKLPEKK